MKRTGGALASILALAALLTVFTLPVLAAEEGTTETGSTTTTVAESSGLVPAVQLSDDQPVAPEQDWTYRFLVPTGLALAVIVILFTSIRYFTNVVRERYRIVEE